MQDPVRIKILVPLTECAGTRKSVYRTGTTESFYAEELTGPGEAGGLDTTTEPHQKSLPPRVARHLWGKGRTSCHQNCSPAACWQSR
ncbi:hypothetical protein NDU88_006376 [Pleurodeles waltl]|uniref:Uncharacterized protein n=1 Tax=Pleurodeles waltl TaxID=8319 RepID=A0AAV7N3A1_PLEWA|nr:hypothetical protein NDU88_006376 [Pleurodeles waltl]